MTPEQAARLLEAEKVNHAVTRNRLQAEISAVWRLVPGHYTNLMNTYPPLRRLLHLLGEAADLENPAKSSNLEGVRTHYTPDGETLTPVERGVLTHQRHRANVTTLTDDLEWFTHKVAGLVAGEPAEYHPPDGTCLECHRPLFQTTTGRRREYCSKPCRQKATRRNATKPETAVGS